MAGVEPNMRVLRRSRKKPQPGDVFAMLFPSERYVFGRVVDADLPRERGPMPHSYLVYIYRVRSTHKEPDRRLLRPDQLLVAPIFINQLPWRKGYFETVAHWPLEPGDLLAEHCFYDTRTDGYVDKFGTPRANKVEPCGIWALASYWTFDDKVSDALGIPRAPEEEPPGGGAASQPGHKAGGSDDGDPPAEAGEQAVVVYVPPADDELTLHELEDALAAAVESAGAGELDGNEVGPNGAAVYLYGANGDRILEAARPVLNAMRLPPGSHAIVRYGQPRGERRVDLT